ncbi:MAG: SIMPL domain-containing protein [Vicinamibacterales bacterium]
MFTTVFAPILLALATQAAGMTTAANEGPVIVTTGEGVVKMAPDRVWVTIAAESRAKNPREAQRANAEAMKAVLDKLKALGLPADAIRTSGYDLQPQFDYVSGRQSLREYVARNTVEVRVDDVSRAGEVLDAAVGSGATSVSGVRFDLKDRGGAEREALKKAVADARGRADAAASGAGMRVDRVIRIEEQRVMMPEPRPMMMARQSMVAETAGPPISPGELEIRSTVTMTSGIK